LGAQAGQGVGVVVAYPPVPPLASPDGDFGVQLALTTAQQATIGLGLAGFGHDPHALLLLLLAMACGAIVVVIVFVVFHIVLVRLVVVKLDSLFVILWGSLLRNC
jgi:hypothetical protein